jgi:hypothetical protein
MLGSSNAPASALFSLFAASFFLLSFSSLFCLYLSSHALQVFICVALGPGTSPFLNGKSLSGLCAPLHLMHFQVSRLLGRETDWLSPRLALPPLGITSYVKEDKNGASAACTHKDPWQVGCWLPNKKTQGNQSRDADMSPQVHCHSTQTCWVNCFA